MWETDQFEWIVPVRNGSGTPVRISRWSNTCNCLGVEPESPDFSPGEIKLLKSRLDLSKKLQATYTTQPVSVTLAGTLTGGTQVRWQLHGRVKPILKASADLFFEALSDVAQPYPARQIGLEFARSPANLKVGLDSPHVTVSLRPGKSPAHALLDLKFVASIPVGDHALTVTLQGDLESPRQTISKRLTGGLRVIPGIQCEPSQFVFPAKSVGDEVEETIALRSLTGRVLQIDSVTTNGDGLTVSKMKDESRFVVRQRLLRSGEAQNSVVFVVRSGDRWWSVILPVIGTGVGPSVVR